MKGKTVFKQNKEFRVKVRFKDGWAVQFSTYDPTASVKKCKELYKDMFLGGEFIPEMSVTDLFKNNQLGKPT